MERRDFLKGLAATTTALAAGYLAPGTQEFLENRDAILPKFPTNQLGTNIHLGAARWYGLDQVQTTEDLLSLPYGYVRIPAPFNEDLIGSNWTFKSAHKLVEEAARNGKKIILQTGLKTIGHPEIRPSAQMLKDFPYLVKTGVALDTDPEFRKIIIKYHRSVFEHFKDYPEIRIIQPENEGWSQRLEVSDYRYFSENFLNEVLDLTRNEGAPGWKILQNIPMVFDTPEAAPRILLNPRVDIVGFNIYNNIHPALNLLIWPWVETVTKSAHALGKGVVGTEFQAAPWINSDRTPKYQFSDYRFNDGLQRLKSLGVDIIFPWDIEQVIWLMNAKNDSWAKAQFDKLHALV